MAYPALFIRKAQIALLVMLLWLSVPNLAVHAAGSGQPNKPAATCTIHPPDGWRPYRLAPGETLATFAQQHGVTEEQLRQVNCLPTATVRPNFLLLAPSNSVTGTPIATATVTPPVTPTLPPAPTVTPTIAPTVPPAPTVTTAMSPTATATRTVTPTLTATATATPTLANTPTATVQAVTNGQAKPPAASRTVLLTPAPAVGDVAINWAGQLWFMVALLLVMIVLTGYFALGEAMPTPMAANHGLVSFIGYTLLILAGFLVGLFATSLFQPASPFSRPTFAGGVGTVLLIGLLTLKEVASPWTGQAKALRRLVSMALVPLLAIFLIAAVSRLAAFLR